MVEETLIDAMRQQGGSKWAYNAEVKRTFSPRKFWRGKNEASRIFSLLTKFLELRKSLVSSARALMP
jgi:hypothetical protein